MQMELAQGVVAIRTVRAKLGKRRQEMEAKLAQVDADIMTADRMLKLLAEEMPTTSTDLPRAEIVVGDIKHCKTQADVLRTYAELNNGLANITPAADLIMEAGMSKGKRNSVRSTLYNHVIYRSSEWKWERPGTFRWIGNGRGPVPDADEPRHVVPQEEA